MAPILETTVLLNIQMEERVDLILVELYINLYVPLVVQEISQLHREHIPRLVGLLELHTVVI